MADAPERIIVFIDNSLDACASIRDQYAAVEYYCETKFAANPETEVTVFTMGSADLRCVIYPPTRSSVVVSDSLKSMCIGGSLCLLEAMNLAFCLFFGDIGNRKKRMLFLVGSLVIMTQKDVELRGPVLKELDIVVDVVNFYLGKTPQDTSVNQYGSMELNAFVNAAKSDDNSHIEHVQPGSDIHEVVSKLIFKKTLHDSMIKTDGRENAKRKNHSLLSGETKCHKSAKGKNHADGDNEHGQISSGQGEANSPPPPGSIPISTGYYAPAYDTIGTNFQNYYPSLNEHGLSRSNVTQMGIDDNYECGEKQQPVHASFFGYETAESNDNSQENVVDYEHANTINDIVLEPTAECYGPTSPSPSSSQPKVSFADLLKESTNIGKQHKLRFIPPLVTDDGLKKAVIPHSVVAKRAEAWANTLIGYFIGKHPAFPLVKFHANRLWKKFELDDVIMNDQGFFYLKFKNEQGLMHVLENGPWLFNDIPIFLQRWHPGMLFDKPKPTKVSLWVNIYDIPIDMWDYEFLSHLASVIGVPIAVDRYTAEMVDKQSGRALFARVLVEVDAEHEIPKAVIADFDNIDRRFRLHYHWVPPRCSHCKIFGHTFDDCTDKPRTVAEMETKIANAAPACQVGPSGATEGPSRGHQGDPLRSTDQGDSEDEVYVENNPTTQFMES